MGLTNFPDGIAIGAALDEVNATGGLVGVTSSAAEVNILTGCTATAAELNQLANLVLVGSTTSIADSLAIPVTHRYVAKTTGADAESLTLANGANGQIITICLTTDGGGDGTLTPTTKSGFTNIVFADAGDTATLQYITTVGWVILGLSGKTAPPVFA